MAFKSKGLLCGVDMLELHADAIFAAILAPLHAQCPCLHKEKNTLYILTWHSDIILFIMCKMSTKCSRSAENAIP
jgi:hypothetical protein